MAEARDNGHVAEPRAAFLAAVDPRHGHDYHAIAKPSSAAAYVTLLVRGASDRETMSDFLVQGSPKIPGVEVAQLGDRRRRERPRDPPSTAFSAARPPP
jgi:hypothetical protein